MRSMPSKCWPEVVRLLAIPLLLQAAGCSGDDNANPAPADGGPNDTGTSDVTTHDATPGNGDGGTSSEGGDRGVGALSRVNHVVVIYLENHSFDNLFGSWPGAIGLADAGIAQLGPAGTPYSVLPQYGPYPAEVESLVDASIGNGPFDLTGYFQEGAFVNDLLHRFYQEQNQIHAGKMDSFVLWNDESAGQSMGFWPTSSLPFPQWMQAHASDVTLCDHFFHAAFGGSFLNHFWLIAAQSPTYPNAPADAGLTAQLDDAGQLQGTLDTTTVPPSLVYSSATDDGELTPDGYAVNTAYSVNEPHPAKYDMPGAKTYQLIPQQTFPTIADRLDGAGVSWAWYAGGWNAALEAAGIASVGTDGGSSIPDSGAGPDIGAYGFQFHHQPFTYFANWGGTANDGGVGANAPNGKWATGHNLRDEDDFLAQAAAGTLPAVSFVKPLYDEHSNYTTETDSQNHTVALLTAIMGSPNWKDTVVVITYDENGGFWDHVAPPVTDKWGPGTRVPGVVVSPFAQGGVDSTVYDTTAILKLIEERWSLASTLRASRDAAQNDLAAHALNLK